MERLALRDQVLDRLDTVFRRLDDDATLVLVVAAEADRTIDLSDDGVVLRTTSFEQFGNTRQTTGDVLGLGAFQRRTCKHVTLGNLLTRLDRQDRVNRQLEAGISTARQLHDATAGVHDDDRRLEVRTARGRTPVDNLTLGDTRGFVGRFENGETIDDVFELNGTRDFRHHWTGVRIPLCQTLTALDLVAIIDVQLRTVGDALRRAFDATLVENGDRHVAAHSDENTVRVAQQVAVLHLHGTFVRCFEERLVDHVRRTTKVERTHGELRARLADRLRGDDANGFTHVDRCTAGKVTTVADRANAGLNFAGQCRTDTDRLDTGLLDLDDIGLEDHLAGIDDTFAGDGMIDIVERGTTENANANRCHDLTSIDDGGHGEALVGAAIHEVDDAILRDVDETAGQVTRVCRLQSGVCETLTGTVGRVEVLVNGQTFLEVRRDRRLDDFTRRLGHEAAHAAQLAHLVRRTTGTRVRHHVDGVHLLLATRFRIELDGLNAGHHVLGDLFGCLTPSVDDLVVLLTLSDQAVVVLLLVFLDQVFGVADDLRLRVRDNHVVLAERNAGAAGVGEAELHDAVAENDRVFLAAMTVDRVDHLGDVLLGHFLVADVEGHLAVLRQEFADEQTARGRFVDLRVGLAILVDRLEAAADLGVQRHDLVFKRVMQFAQIGEGHAFARFVLVHDREVVQAENHVLRRNDDRCTVCRVQDVVRRHHKDAGFELGFQRQRHVNGHLVTVEVGVEGRADERVQLDSLAFDQDRFEGLDAQAVQRRCAVQENRMLADNLVEDIPNFRLFLLNQLLGLLDGRGVTLGVEAGVDERLEQFERHLLRQAALVQLQFRAGHDDRTAGIVDALAEQVLTEAALLALEHVGQRLQRTLVGAGDDAATAAVVEQRVHRFLQHALFVADDDARSAQFDQALQTVVTVDDATIEIVQVGGRKAAAIKRNQRAQVRRDDWDDLHDHPFRAVAGLHEVLDDLQALHQLLLLEIRRGVGQIRAQVARNLLKVHRCQHFEDGFSADHGGELIFAVLVDGKHIFFFRQELVLLERGEARLGDDVVFEVENALYILQRHVEQRRNARRKRLQEPDVGNGSGELDVAHALTANARQRNFDAALFADDALVLHALVLAAQAFVVLDRSEDAGAEQTIAFRLERTIVDRFRLLDLTIRPGENLLRRRNRDPDGIEILRRHLRIEKIHDLLVHACLLHGLKALKLR